MSKILTIAVAMMAAFLSLSTTACTMNGDGAHLTGVSSGDAAPGSYCYEHTTMCVVGGVAVVALAAGIIASNNDGGNGGGCAPRGAHGFCAPSDARLKTDIRPLTTLNNGIRLYTFHYRGDSRLFSGVLAQDLLNNPAFAKSVVAGKDGYYRVDYGMLGLPLVNGDVMIQAGEKAALGL